MKITLVRHGETEYNELGKIQGISNIPLNDKGRRQCKRLKEKIKDKSYDICFSSPLIRAMETAMILVGDRVLINKDKRLIERTMGEYEGVEKKQYEYKTYWNIELNSNDKGVEPIKDILNRCDEFIKYLKKEYKDKSILIVSHSAIVRALIYILKKPDINKELMNIDIKNCYFEEIEIK